MNTREVLLFPKALRGLRELDAGFSRQILADTRLLELPPWPPGKVKKLYGTELWEIKTGGFRSLFFPEGRKVVVVRVVNRRDLDKTVKRFDPAFILQWLRGT